MGRFGYNERSDFKLVCIFCCAPIVFSEQARLGAANRWRSEFRALYNEEGEWNSPRVSGIGDRLIDDVVPVDFDKHRREYGATPSADLRLIWAKPRDNPDYPYCSWDDPVPSAWGFFGHVSCWALFRIVCGLSDVDLQALNNLCRSSPSNSGFIQLGLEYGRVPLLIDRLLGLEYGEVPLLDAVCSFEELQRSPRTPMYEADPLDIGWAPTSDQKYGTRRSVRILDQCNRAGFSFPDGAELPQTQQPPASARNDCFINLPEEMRLAILIHLPSRDVVNAKIASTALAHTALGVPFWKSRFCPDQEFHCIFERPPALMRVGGWKRLFAASKTLRNHLSFQNRQRIWTALRQLQSLLSGIAGRQLHGKALRSAFEKREQYAPKVKRFASAKVLISEVRDNPGVWDLQATGSRTFDSGCKALFSRLVIIPADVEGISATLVRHHEQTFIAGMAFRSRKIGNIYIGYMDPGNLESIDFEGNTLAGFRVSSCQMGLCGVSAVFETGVSSAALGSMGTLPKSQILLMKSGAFTLMCDFDAFKMLRFGIHESISKAKGQSIQGRCRIYRDDYQWSPNLPDASHFLSESRVLKKDRTNEWNQYLPRVTCMYGGEQGELLGKITKLTVWFVQIFVVGIEFHYSDTSTILGRRFPFNQMTLEDFEAEFGESWQCTYDLDGPGGEVITGFHVLQVPELCHLRICTNFGRIFRTEGKGGEGGEVGPLERRELAPIKYPEPATILGIYVDLHDWSEFGILGIISKNLD